MKRWVVGFIGAIGFIASYLIVVPQGEEYGPHAISVCYVATPGLSGYNAGKIIVMHPDPEWEWSAIERGEVVANEETGLRYRVVTLDLAEAESNTVVGYYWNFKIDDVDTPATVISDDLGGKKK